MFDTLSAEDILNGKDKNGIRYLTIFCKKYETITKKKCPCISCNGRLRKIELARKELLYLINKKDNIMETNFRLKTKYIGLPYKNKKGTIIYISNANLTDEQAIELIKDKKRVLKSDEYPLHFFDKKPKDVLSMLEGVKKESDDVTLENKKSKRGRPKK